MDENHCLSSATSAKNVGHDFPISPQTLDIFHPFRLLPVELRFKIWELLPEDRLVEVYWNKMRRKFMTFDPIPAILQVCKESRYLALRSYKLLKFPIKMDYTNGVCYSEGITRDGQSAPGPPRPRPFDIIQSQSFCTYLDYTRDAIVVSSRYHFLLNLDNRPYAPLYDFTISLLRQKCALQIPKRIALEWDLLFDVAYMVEEEHDLLLNIRELIIIDGSARHCCFFGCDDHHKILDFEAEDWPNEPSLRDLDSLSSPRWDFDDTELSSKMIWEVLEESFHPSPDQQYWQNLKISGVKVTGKSEDTNHTMCVNLENNLEYLRRNMANKNAALSLAYSILLSSQLSGAHTQFAYPIHKGLVLSLEKTRES